MDNRVLSITQINEYVRQLMDKDVMLSGVAVRGEISNYKVYPSGHHYFTLKDENAALKCVMFRSSAIRLRFKMENGMKVIAIGKISVYPRDGAYQLYCNSISLDGIGDLHIAFEQLKKKLAGRGLFDPEHKKVLPKYPRVIGIVTSSAGAAIHDMLRILRARYPVVSVRLLPVRVQGQEAPDEIAAAIRYANKHSLADVLIVGRGGGSIEDLWAFNDEKVAQAIYDSQIPVISAVGHEPDITISDYVADVRAATPSNAAEIVVPDQNSIRQGIDAMSAAMTIALNQRVKAARQRIDTLSKSSVLQSPDTYIKLKRATVQQFAGRLVSAEKLMITHYKQNFCANTGKLDAMSPLKVMSRGYSIVRDANERIVRTADGLNRGDELNILLRDGSVSVIVESVKEKQ